MKQRPRLYFAFRSPYSWMAVRRLEERLPRATEIIEFRPYWEPDAQTRAALDQRGVGAHYTAMTKAKHLYILADTKRLAQRLGYPMMWPIDIDPCWEGPHLGWLRAQRQGADQAFYHAVVAARWERGEDICDPLVLHRTARAVGLDGDDIVAAVKDPVMRAEGADALAAAYDDDVFGVPYFKVGRHRFWGLDRLDAFLEALPPGPAATCAEGSRDGARKGVPHELLGRIGGYGDDTPGGCG